MQQKETHQLTVYLSPLFLFSDEIYICNLIIIPYHFPGLVENKGGCKLTLTEAIDLLEEVNEMDKTKGESAPFVFCVELILIPMFIKWIEHC